MPKVVMFLGAGASRAFGVPTTKEFVPKFEDELEKSTSESALGVYPKIIKMADNYSNIVDLETVFEGLRLLGLTDHA